VRNSKRFLYGLFFGLLILANMGLSGYRLNESAWEGYHHGFIFTEYPHNALNYVRFGYGATRLGLVMDYGMRPAGQTSTSPCDTAVAVAGWDGRYYRVDHGFLTSLLISFSYRLFGVRDGYVVNEVVFLIHGIGDGMI